MNRGLLLVVGYARCALGVQFAGQHGTLLQPQPRSSRVSARYDCLDVRVRESCRASTILPRCLTQTRRPFDVFARWQVRLADHR